MGKLLGYYTMEEAAARAYSKYLMDGIVPGRGLQSSAFQLNLSRFGHASRVALSNRLVENHAPNESCKTC